MRELAFHAAVGSLLFAFGYSTMAALRTGQTLGRKLTRDERWERTEEALARFDERDAVAKYRALFTALVRLPRPGRAPRAATFGAAAARTDAQG